MASRYAVYPLLRADLFVKLLCLSPFGLFRQAAFGADLTSLCMTAYWKLRLASRSSAPMYSL